MTTTTTAFAPEQVTPEVEAPRPLLARIFDFDLSQPLAFFVLAIAYIASRAPFINVGYGTDPDAWRVALSGYWLWDHGEFYPSRLPGYPLPEFASAAVIQVGGHLATNSLTIAVSLLGLWFFARIVAKLDLPSPALVIIGFAFTPLLWINSMTTMDYMYALTFLMGCYYFLLCENTGYAGLMLGLAAASRSTSILMMFPFLIYLWRDGKRGETRDFVVWAIFVPMIAWLPIVWKYGPSFLNFYDAKVGYLNVLRLLAKDCLGFIGSLTVLAAILISLPRLAKLPVDFLRDKNVTVWVLVIAITCVVFSRLPHESAYLIPVYPFGFFIMAKYFRRGVLLASVAAIILAGFVDIGTNGADLNKQAIRHARIGEGLVLSNQDTQKAQLAFTRELTNYNVPNKTVVSIGYVYPQFAVLNRDTYNVGILEKDKAAISQLSDKGKAEDPLTNKVFVWLLDWNDYTRYRDLGYGFMYTPDAGRSTAALYGFRPGILNEKLLDLGRNPTGGSGGARTDR